MVNYGYTILNYGSKQPTHQIKKAMEGPRKIDLNDWHEPNKTHPQMAIRGLSTNPHEWHIDSHAFSLGLIRTY